MKILHTVQLYSPSVGGMQEVVKQISERLVLFGHDVYVATTKLSERDEYVVNGVNIIEFNISGNISHGMVGNISEYKDFVIKGDFDIITNFAAQQWATDVIIPELEKINIPKVFVPTGFSGLYDSKYSNYFESMKAWMKNYDMNVFLSDNYRDINFARENGVKNITVIPNGASEDEFLLSAENDNLVRLRLGIPTDNLLILTVGSHTGLKGHAEAIKIFSKAKLENATLVIVANSSGGGCSRSCRRKQFLFKKWPLNKIRGKQMIVCELSREQTVSIYKAADIFLFPSNIECSPLVLFEAMASKTPFLATDVGNAVEIIQWSRGGMLLPTFIDKKGNSRAKIKESVLVLEELVRNKKVRSQMREFGFEAWKKEFTWGRIAKTYEALYKSLIDKNI